MIRSTTLVPVIVAGTVLVVLGVALVLLTRRRRPAADADRTDQED